MIIYNNFSYIHILKIGYVDYLKVHTYIQSGELKTTY